MLRLTPRRVLVSGVLLFLLLVALVLIFSRDPRAADEPFLTEVPLWDGVHRLRLLRTEAGETLTYDWKAPVITTFRNSMYPYLGGKAPREYDISIRPIARYPHRDDMNSARFLFRVVNDRNQWANPYDYEHLHYEFVESTGFVFKGYLNGMGIHSTGGAALLDVEAFPRRDKELTLRVRDGGQKDPKQFTIPNPYYRSDYPAWTPTPVPAIQTHGDFTVRLSAVEDYDELGFRPKFHQKLAADQWELCESMAHFEDATGNRGIDLSPFEPAWKVVADVLPAWSAPCPADKIQVMGPFRIPAVGEIVPIENTVNVAGTSVMVRLLCGGGTVNWTQPGRWKVLPTVASARELGANPHLLTGRADDWKRDHDRVHSENLNMDMDTDSLPLHEPIPFVVIEAKYPEGHGLSVRCRTERGMTGRTTHNLTHYYSDYYPVAIPVLGDGDTAEEFTVELIERRAERFEFIFEPPQRWRDKSAALRK